MALRPNDPIAQVIHHDYEVVNLPSVSGAGPIPALWLFRRKDAIP